MRVETVKTVDGEVIGFGYNVSTDSVPLYSCLYLNPEFYIKALGGDKEFLPFDAVGYRVCKFAPAITEVIGLPNTGEGGIDILRWVSDRRRLLKVDKHSMM